MPMRRRGYLKQQFDRAVMRDGVRLVRRIGENPALACFKAAGLSPLERNLASDEAIDAWVQQRANTIFHPVGTCRMGADGDAEADAELEANCVAGARIAEASVMPPMVGAILPCPL